MRTLIQNFTGDFHFFDRYDLHPHLALLIVLLVIATAIDVREHRIPNWLVISGIIIGLLFHMAAPQGQGLIFSLLGMSLGLVMLLPLYAINAMGAGDIKLLGMIGVFLGSSGVFGAALATMAAGGVLALCMATGKRMLPQLLANLRLMLVQRHIRQLSGAAASALPDPPSVGKMPYAVAICAGTLVQLFFLS